ncbi:MAG TPA: ABC transporter permease [Gaiellaceae bacterium]|jgi:simple sugar transport system permease protein
MSALSPAVQGAIRSEATAKYVGWASVGLAALGLWLALPPVTLRSPAVPFVLTALAALGGAWTAARGERKLGWGAVAAAGICAVIAYGATRSSVEHLDGAFTTTSGPGVIDWGVLTYNMFIFATPLAFAAIGGMFSERSGVVNIGLEGMMLSGCFFGILGADKLNSWELGLVTAALSGAVLGLIHAFFSVHMRSDQIVGGTAINFLALGVTGYFFIQIYGLNGTPGTGIPYIPDVKLSFLNHIPPKDPDRPSFWYQAFGHLNLMIWVLFGVIVLAYFVMFRTSIGLRLRSVGEHPRAADTVGIDVYRTRYGAVILSGMIASLGGAYLAIGYVHSFTENMTAGRGFIGLAALIAGNWRPGGAFAFALLFGFFGGLATRVQGYGYEYNVLVQSIPYVITLIAVVGVIGRSIPPASVGRPYVKQ